MVTIGGSYVEKQDTRLRDSVLIHYPDHCRGCDEYFVNVGGISSNERLKWTCGGEKHFFGDHMYRAMSCG